MRCLPRIAWPKMQPAGAGLVKEYREVRRKRIHDRQKHLDDE